MMRLSLNSKTTFQLGITFLIFLAIPSHLLLARGRDCDPPKTPNPPCKPILTLQLKQQSLERALGYGIKLAQEKIKSDLIGKEIGNSVDIHGEVTRNIPLITPSSPEDCNDLSKWEKLGMVEKWDKCLGIPEYLILSREEQKAKNKSILGRWKQNISDLMKPIPAEFDLQRVKLDDLQLGPITIKRVSNQTLVREKMTPAHKRDVETFVDDRNEDFEEELDQRLANGEKVNQTEYELTIPIKYLNVNTRLIANGAGFAKGRNLIDIDKMSVILDSRKIPGNPNRTPATIQLRFVLGKDGEIAQFKYLTPHSEKASHIEIPLESMFISYYGTNQPIQGDTLAEQSLTQETKDRIQASFKNQKDLDNFTWFANYINNKHLSNALKYLFNGLLESIVEDKIFPIIQEQLHSTLTRYTDAEKEEILDISAFRVSRQLDKNKIENRNREIRAIEKEILLNQNAFNLPRADRKAFKKLNKDIENYIDKFKDILKTDKGREDTSSVEEYSTHFNNYEKITGKLKEFLEKAKTYKDTLDRSQISDLEDSIKNLDKLWKKMVDVAAELESNIENQQLKYKVKIFSTTLKDIHNLLNVSVLDLLNPENENCTPIKNIISPKVPDSSDGTLRFSIDGLNQKLSELHKLRFFDFCYNSNEIRDCPRHKVTDLAADIWFKNPPRLQWDAAKKTHFIDLSELQIKPKGLASIAGLVIPKAMNAKVYLTPKTCTKENMNSICLDAQLFGQVTSTDRGIIEKIISRIQVGTEIQPAVVEKIISKYAPNLQETIKKYPIPTQMIQFDGFTQNQNEFSFNFKFN